MSQNAEDNDMDNVEGGDLGLGKGLKPGAVPREGFDCEFVADFHVHKYVECECDDANDGHSISSDISLSSDVERHSSTSSAKGSMSTLTAADEEKSIMSKSSVLPDATNKTNSKSLSKLAEKLKWLRKNNWTKELPDDVTEAADLSDVFTSLDQVSIGTSLKQQRRLFESELSDLMSKIQLSELHNQTHLQSKDSTDKSENGILESKLLQAEMEIDLLKQQLALCQRHLEAKYGAIQILQNQASAMHEEHANNKRKARIAHRKLEQEINQLQFEMEHQQSTFMDSQQIWAERFDRVCQENSALTTNLEARSEDVRRLTADKMGLCRERDELMALLDIQERQRYESARSPSVDEALTDLTSIELATLSACRCQDHGFDPCGCAHSAALIKRDVVRLKEQLEHYKQRHQDEVTTTDSYRMAFEEQLSRNRGLMNQLAAVSAAPLQTRSSKARAAVRWLIKQLNEEEPRPILKDESGDDVNGALDADAELDGKSEEELICMLVDMVSDKSEALAHQRLAARMLASKTKELEQKLSAATEDVYVK